MKNMRYSFITGIIIKNIQDYTKLVLRGIMSQVKLLEFFEPQFKLLKNFNRVYNIDPVLFQKNY